VKRINLLPPEQRTRESRERGLIWAILIVVGVAAVLGLVYVYERNQVTAKESELAQVTAQTLGLQQQVAALQPYAQIQATRTSMTDTAKGIYDARVLWSTILQEISLVIPDNVRLQDRKSVV
jgi:Tfp pilus assembly protein PilN